MIAAGAVSGVGKASELEATLRPEVDQCLWRRDLERVPADPVEEVRASGSCRVSGRSAADVMTSVAQTGRTRRGSRCRAV
jgi:hypothetical protein